MSSIKNNLGNYIKELKAQMMKFTQTSVDNPITSQRPEVIEQPELKTYQEPPPKLLTPYRNTKILAEKEFIDIILDINRDPERVKHASIKKSKNID